MRKKYFKKNYFIIILLFLLVVFFSFNVFSVLPDFCHVITSPSSESCSVNEDTNCVYITSAITFDPLLSEETSVRKQTFSSVSNGNIPSLDYNDFEYNSEKLYKYIECKINSSQNLAELEDSLNSGEFVIEWNGYNKKYCTHRGKWYAKLNFIRTYINEDGKPKNDTGTYSETAFYCKDFIPPRVKIKETIPKLNGEEYTIEVNITDDETALLYDIDNGNEVNQNDKTYLYYYDFSVLSNNEKLFEKTKEDNLKEQSYNFSFNIKPEDCNGECKIVFTGEDSSSNTNESYTYTLTPRYLSIGKIGYCTKENLCYYGGNNLYEYSFENTDNPECVLPGTKINNEICDKDYGWVDISSVNLGAVLKGLENYDNVAVYCNNYEQILDYESKKEDNTCDSENNFCDQSCIGLGFDSVGEYYVFYSQMYKDDIQKGDSIKLNKKLSNNIRFDIISEDAEDCVLEENNLYCDNGRLMFNYDDKILFYTNKNDYYDTFKNYNSTLFVEEKNVYFKDDFDYFKEKLKDYYNTAYKDYIKSIQGSSLIKLDENAPLFFTKTFAYRKSNDKEIIGSVVKLKRVRLSEDEEDKDLYTEPIIVLYYKGFSSEDKNLIYKALTENLNKNYLLKNIKSYEDDNNLLIIGLSSEDSFSEQLERFVVRLR